VLVLVVLELVQPGLMVVVVEQDELELVVLLVLVDDEVELLVL
jgi:hypothetical protein